jgi:hypothetical protein
MQSKLPTRKQMCLFMSMSAKAGLDDEGVVFHW